MVFLGKTAKKTLWLYLAKRAEESDSVFGLDYHSIQTLLKRLGKTAKVQNVHAHRFRHTFAINYLRNGGDVFTLQRLLGHATLEMVRHYLDLVKTDVQNAHRMASPVDRMKL